MKYCMLLTDTLFHEVVGLSLRLLTPQVDESPAPLQKVIGTSSPAIKRVGEHNTPAVVLVVHYGVLSV